MDGQPSGPPGGDAPRGRAPCGPRRGRGAGQARGRPRACAREAVFTCLDVGEAERARVLAWAQEMWGPGRSYQRTICDHVTTLFLPAARGPADADLRRRVCELHRARLGETVQLRPVALHVSPTLAALEVELPADLLCANAHPHITLALSPPSAPKDSNALIAAPPDPVGHVVVPCGARPGPVAATVSWSPAGSALPQ